MPFLYKKVLVIGATSGIGHALATKIIECGSKVIAVGRRQENLEAFVQLHGSSKASSAKFDITNLESIPGFVKEITKIHPDLDCIILNSGIQRPVDFTKPESIELSMLSVELTTNYLSHVHLAVGFLPFLQAQFAPTSLVFVTSGLALVPLLRAPNYSASKAGLHSLILCMREQLKGSNVKIIELLPPAVQTELHDTKHQPDIKNGSNFGMPLDQFTDAAWVGLEEGIEQIPVGTSVARYEAFEWKRQAAFHQLVEMMRDGLK